MAVSPWEFSYANHWASRISEAQKTEIQREFLGTVPDGSLKNILPRAGHSASPWSPALMLPSCSVTTIRKGWKKKQTKKKKGMAL